MRATEVMKRDESSYRVRFVTVRASGFASHQSSRSISSHNLADLAAGNRYSPAHTSVDLDRSSVNSSYSDLRLSTLNYPVNQHSFSTISAFPTSTPHHEDVTSSARSLSYPLTEWHMGEGATLPDEEEHDKLLEMEGQGVLIYDHHTGAPSHVSI